MALEPIYHFVIWVQEQGTDSLFVINSNEMLTIQDHKCTQDVEVHMSGNDYQDKGEERSDRDDSWTITYVLTFGDKVVRVEAPRDVHRNEDCKWVWYTLLHIIKQEDTSSWFQSDDKATRIKLDKVYSTERTVQNGVMLSL
jgi:hypothetical protein